MDPDLLSYLSGGFFTGTPALVPMLVHVAPAVRPDAGHRPVYGLWLHPEDVELLLEEELPMAPARRPPVQQHLQRALTLREFTQEVVEDLAFRILGFQVIGFEDDRTWTWTEAALADTVTAEIDADCDGHGLLPDRANAVAAAHFLNREDLGPPVIWRPWLLSAHLPSGGV